MPYSRSSTQRHIHIFICLLLAASAVRAEDDPYKELTKGQPKEVAAVAKRIAICTHFAGEEPYDAERQQELAAALKKYRCGRLDKDEAALFQRYKDKPSVKAALQRAHEW
ncbi:hypothetical protein ABT364_03295 [Massilia sp. SR12]